MTSQEKQIVKEMGLKYQIVESEVIIQGKILLTDYNRIMNSKPWTKPPKQPTKPPAWAQTLIANQASDHALIVQLVSAVTAQGNQMNAMQQDLTDIKSCPTIQKELGIKKP